MKEQFKRTIKRKWGPSPFVIRDYLVVRNIHVSHFAHANFGLAGKKYLSSFRFRFVSFLGGTNSAVVFLFVFHILFVLFVA